MNCLSFDRLRVMPDSDQHTVAAAIADELTNVATLGDEVCAVFATGETQVPVLNSLTALPIDWSKVGVFHLDEFVGIGIDHPVSFARFIKEKIGDRVGISFDRLHLINGMLDPEEECSRYSAELRPHVPDLCVLGIGGNGHLAFNEPGSIDEGEYHDLLSGVGSTQREGLSREVGSREVGSREVGHREGGYREGLSQEEGLQKEGLQKEGLQGGGLQGGGYRTKWPLVKVVHLDEQTRLRQVEEGLFGNMDEVPNMAVTLSMTAILSAKCIIAACTGEHKAGIVRDLLKDDISPDCPASLLRLHDNATLFLDQAAASRLG
ncbi:MAG: 6-phosphogluconolactonase [Actinobacteria bacterium]|nr:6-phosphogluconolactonase [Actinomycetota bacterium]